MNKYDTSCKCKVCGKHPHEIKLYALGGELRNMTAEEFVKMREPSYNKDTHKFLCSKCWMKNGMPDGIA